MQHMRIAVYQFKPGTVDEVIQAAERGMLPLFRSQPGFIQYTVVKTGDDAAVSTSSWETREQAEKAVATAAGWVRENIAEKLVSVENHTGEVVIASWQPVRA